VKKVCGLGLLATGNTLVHMAHDQNPEVDFIEPMVYDSIYKGWEGGPNGH
jgi:hypothetical protein